MFDRELDPEASSHAGNQLDSTAVSNDPLDEGEIGEVVLDIPTSIAIEWWRLANRCADSASVEVAVSSGIWRYVPALGLATRRLVPTTRGQSPVSSR